MKSFLKTFRLTVVFSIFLSVFYILVLWLFAVAAGPNHGKPEVVTYKSKVVGAANEGQLFVSDRYFWGRPSYAGDGYDATKSGASNASVSNPAHLAEVQKRVSRFLVHHPYLTAKDIPTEMVTASGSGLDPDITQQSAAIQVKRVAKARGMREDDVDALVEKCTDGPFLGWFGPSKVNVLKLNVELDKIDSQYHSFRASTPSTLL